MKIIFTLFTALTVVGSAFGQSGRRAELTAAEDSTAGSGGASLRPANGALAEATTKQLKAAADREDGAAKIARERWQRKSFEEFKAAVYKEPFEGGKYIVNGDIAIADEKQLREFFEESILGTAPGAADHRLIKMAGPNGTWNSARKRELTYCVSSTFGARRAKVISDLAAAAKAWEDVADVHYVHVAEADGACTPSNDSVLFDVRPVDVQGEYLARAFFPNEGRSARNVLIDESAFHVTGNLQLVGVLRHELGHTLGWRHEHTRPESGACFEDKNWVPLTRYDTFSVMHYPQCNGGGDWKLTLTATDRSGAACVYGPAPGFVIDQTLVDGTCLTPVTSGPTPGTLRTEKLDDKTVAKGEYLEFGPFDVRPGTVLIAQLSPHTGAAAGDADLYVQLGRAPTRPNGGYTCRPYLSTSNETCEVSTLLAPRNKVFVTVHGYSGARFDLAVTYLPNGT